MFCEYQEKVIQFDDYTRESTTVIMCNEMDRECPYSKLKKAQKRCPYLIPIEEEND